MPCPTNRLDGRAWGLILDEAHLASVEVLEEIRILSNRLRQPDGFAALVLVGQTAMNRRLASAAPWPRWRPGWPRGSSSRPIDADEAGVLVDRLAPGRALDLETLERCHRDAGGNPRRLLVLASREPVREGRPAPSPKVDRIEWFPLAWPESDPYGSPAPESPRAGDPRGTTSTDDAAVSEEDGGTPSTSPSPSFEPFRFRSALASSSRPPLSVEEGMIEVGWQAADEPDDGEGAEEGRLAPPTGEDEGPEEASSVSQAESERLADHYAALQAWSEWSRNQGSAEGELPAGLAHLTEAEPSAVEVRMGRPEEGADSSRHASHEAVGIRPGVWAEAQHNFAPYSQLFSRLRQARDSDD